ncbi:MAG: HD domain-containing protein [Nanoarchaeota archaeon]
MTKFELIKKEIESILPNSPLDFELKHSKLVLKWALNLKPNADGALKIAALSHDIDRAITKITEKDLKDFSKIDEFKKEHSIRSAEFICNILKKHNYPQKIIDKVKHLVENHEFGGDEESNILMDADSLAYFDYNIPSYLKRNGAGRTKEKIKFMYKRMSAKAKKLVNQIKFKDQEIARLIKESISEL